jgi:hypothetical protein
MLASLIVSESLTRPGLRLTRFNVCSAVCDSTHRRDFLLNPSKRFRTIVAMLEHAPSFRYVYADESSEFPIAAIFQSPQSSNLKSIGQADAALPDPITLGVVATTIGLWLAQGAVAYVGGKILGSILGDPSLRDAERWIADAVEEIKAFVRAELRAQLTELHAKTLRANLTGAVNQLLYFSKATTQDAAMFRSQLDDAYNMSRAAADLAKEYQLALLPIFVSATSLSLLTLSARFQLDKSTAHSSMMLILVESARKFLREQSDRLLNDWVKFLKPGPVEKTTVRTLPSREDRRDFETLFFCRLHGKWVELKRIPPGLGGENYDEATADVPSRYALLVEKQRAKAESRWASVFVPIQAVEAEWEKLREFALANGGSI